MVFTKSLHPCFWDESRLISGRVKILLKLIEFRYRYYVAKVIYIRVGFPGRYTNGQYCEVLPMVPLQLKNPLRLFQKEKGISALSWILFHHES